MAAEKETIMLLTVDLQCPCCYKKIKKILCKFPQIRDQVYDDKGNKVKITVLCSNPEKIRDKLRCKGAKVITSIEIIKPKVEKEKEKEKKKEEDKEPKKNPEFLIHCKGLCGGPCYHGYGFPPPCYCGCGYGRGVPLRPCYCGYGYGRDCHMNRCDYYLSEDSSCSIM